MLLVGTIPGLRINELVDDGSVFQTTETLCVCLLIETLTSVIFHFYFRDNSMPLWFTYFSTKPLLYFVQPFTPVPGFYEDEGWTAFQALVYAPGWVAMICLRAMKNFRNQ